METDLISQVKKKKEFSQLPNPLIERALNLSNQDAKETRALLRKYFGVFLTNRVLRGNEESILKSHISSKNRDYLSFYKEIFKKDGGFKAVLDIGCGVNGFSYLFLKQELGDFSYLGVEAVGQLVEKMNIYFKEKNFSNAMAVCLDVFDNESIKSLLIKSNSPKVVFLFQVVDALEGFEKNSSKTLLNILKENLSERDMIVISMPMKSISGKTKFEAKRGWLKGFLDENFNVEEFFIGDERIFKCGKK
jgi:hypothetical protein